MSSMRERIKSMAESAESELCLMEHPLARVLCMRKIGHEGAHLFQVRWWDGPSAIADFKDAIERSQ